MGFGVTDTKAATAAYRDFVSDGGAKMLGGAGKFPAGFTAFHNESLPIGVPQVLGRSDYTPTVSPGG